SSFLFAVFFDLVAEHDLGSGLMLALLKEIPTAFARFLQCPASKDFGNFGNVFLGISRINSESLKLHQFTPVVFVQSTLLFLGPLSLIDHHSPAGMAADSTREV